ncbi:MAG: alanine/glycine:cation symporter family protein [Bacteroidia bacterium]|nr:alanine/glycine:cation symporter family protein [Bacteroidia bacterium]
MEKVVNIINDIIWSPALVILLVGAGLYFTIRTRCVQVRRIGMMVRLLFKKHDNSTDPKSMSSFQAFCLSLSGRVGTGNIVGVATAIAIGGPGSVFWMWLIAFLGASTAFTESTLAQLYNFKHDKGLRGGPACYIEKGLKLPHLAVIFAILTIVGYGMFIVLVQVNSMSTAFQNAYNVKPILCGIALAVVLGLVIIGGVKRIAHVAQVVTPFMAIAYIIIALVIIFANIESVPGAFKLIFTNAFGINPLAGGILGTTIAMGVKRGLFSNEAGEGGGAIVSASAGVDKPANQGLVQAFSVYIDTLLVCTATALMIICSGTYNIIDQVSGELLYAGAPELGNNYVGFTQAAVDSVFEGFGSGFVSIALTFFVFTTLMAYYFYSESSLIYIFRVKNKMNTKSEKFAIWMYRFVLLALVVVGSCTASDIAWKFGDIGVGLTTWINVIALLLLFPQALKALNEIDKK